MGVEIWVALGCSKGSSFFTILTPVLELGRPITSDIGWVVKHGQFFKQMLYFSLEPLAIIGVKFQCVPEQVTKQILCTVEE